MPLSNSATNISNEEEKTRFLHSMLPLKFSIKLDCLPHFLFPDLDKGCPYWKFCMHFLSLNHHVHMHAWQCFVVIIKNQNLLVLQSQNFVVLTNKTIYFIVQSVLGFLKVVVARQPVEQLQHHLKSMVEGLLLWSDDSKNHFKAKVGLWILSCPILVGCWEVAQSFFIFTMWLVIWVHRFVWYLKCWWEGAVCKLFLQLHLSSMPNFSRTSGR